MLDWFNRLSLWRCHARVWGHRLTIPSADRLLYATLHRVGLMGKDDRAFFERELKPGMTVADVGANIGLYALHFAKLVGPRGHVYAFEPAPDLYAALVDASTTVPNLSLFPMALGAKAEHKALRRSAFNSGDNRIAEKGDAIEIVRGDEALRDVDSVDFIKIDVQGWEYHALSGMSGLIERSPALQIYLEFWPKGLRDSGAGPEVLFEFLTHRGFGVRRQTGGQWKAAASCAELLAEMREDQYINLWARRRDTKISAPPS